MIKTIKLTSLVILLLCSFAQVNLLAQKYPLELYTADTNQSDSIEHEGQVKLSITHASAIIPVVPLDSFKVILYVKENRKQFSYQEFSDEVTLEEASIPIDDFPETLTLSSLGAWFIYQTDDSIWLFRHDEVVASDGEEISNMDRAYLNQFLYRIISDNQTSWSFSLIERGGIGPNQYIPLFGYRYKGDTFDINLALPSYAIIQYRISKYWYLLWDGTIETDRYRFTKKSPWNNSISNLTSVTSRVETGFRTDNGFEIGLSYGLTSLRWWTIYDKDFNKLGSFDLQNSPTWSLQIQFLF